jgi:hypothetical protein
VPQIKRLLGGTVTRYGGGMTFRWEPGVVTVEFLSGRRQVIKYEADGEQLVLSSRVARRDAVDAIGRERLTRDILLWNRSTEVVAFRFDKRDGIEGFIRQCAGSMAPEELRFYLACLAREADRIEYLLTGFDLH